MSLRPIAQTSDNAQEAEARPVARPTDGGMLQAVLRHLVSSGQSHKGLRSHRDNLWILGGEISSKLHENPRLRFPVPRKGHGTPPK
jgi:hypothetical protein